MTTFVDPSTFPSVFDAPAEISGPAAPNGEATGTTTAGDPTTSASATTETTGAATTAEPVEAATPVEATTPVVAATAEPVEATPADAGTFADLGVPQPLVRALDRVGIKVPFEIQRATVPDALAGRDVLGRGQTGSGKTLAFGLPVLARLAAGERARPLRPRALILVPTRELAMQVNDALAPLGRAVGVQLKAAVGGVPYDRQIDSLRRGVEIIVATPGRLGDLISRGVCRLDEIEVTVLDEADQMADMGFLPDVTDLLDKTPAGGQRLLFSATLDGDVDALVRRFMNDPVTHSTAPATAAVSTMDHHLLLIPPQDKFAVAASIAARQGRTMMFARTQMGVDRLVEQFAAVGVRAGALHGGKTQRVRTRTLAEFKEGRTSVLVATDVAARGIHVDGVSLVVHVDPPKDSKDYLHRAGRTARAGESGAVATLVLSKQRRSTLAMMEKAGVAPEQTRVRSGDAALAALTGAQAPSGVPVVEEPTREDRPRGERRFGDRRFGDRGQGHRGQGYRGQGDRSHSSRGHSERGPGDRAHVNPAHPERGQGDRRFGERPSGERRFGDQGNRGGSGEWRTGDRRGGFRHEGRPRDDRPTDDRARDERRGQGERRFGDRRPAPTR